MIISILENLFFNYKSKFTYCTSKNINRPGIDIDTIQFIEEHISNLENISLDIISSINPSIYAQINIEEGTIPFLIGTFEDWNNKLTQEENRNQRNEKVIKSIQNYINWLGNVLLETARQNPRSLFDISFDDMSLKKVINLKKTIEKYPKKISFAVKLAWKNIALDIKEKSMEILEINESYDKDKIINSYLRLELKHYQNTPRITASPKQKKEHERKLESLKQALHNIELIRGIPANESFLKEINGTRKAAMTEAVAIAKAKGEVILNAPLQENTDQMQKTANEPSAVALIKHYLLDIYQSYLIDPYHYFLKIIGWETKKEVSTN